MSKRSRKSYDNSNISRIILDTASSYIMTFIGSHMSEIVSYFNDLKGRYVQISRIRGKCKDTLLARGRSDDEVHWVYMDFQEKEHNPYAYKMQKKGSHQFCQSHALRLAYCEGCRIVTTPTDAYISLLPIWDEIFHIFELDEDILNEIIELQFEEEPESKELYQAINVFQDNFTHEKLMNIMHSEYAIENAPYFE